MRLVDAEALKRALHRSFPLGALSAGLAVEAVDEAPTAMQ